ncbi:hypothetical protein FS837_012983 [Tulasnella sp. UAMH 9824]|nr:hypothetical protein FS837_012983 [Tulasnella sp. UAMH 9824]
MSSNPNATGTNPSRVKKATRGQIAIQAAAASNPEVGEATTANGRKLRDTMAAKNGVVAENILREQTLEREFTAAGGTVTDGVNAQSRLKALRITVDAAGRSPSSLVAATSSSPVAEEDLFSYRRGPPQTPTRIPAHFSTVPQSLDSPDNPSTLTAAPARPRQIPQPLASTNVPQPTAADTNASSHPPNTWRTGDALPSPGNAQPSRAPPPAHTTGAPARPSQTLQLSASASIVPRTAADVDTRPRPSNTRQSEATTTGQGNVRPHQAPVPSASTTILPSAQPAPPSITSAQPALPPPIAPAQPTAPAHGSRPTISASNLHDPWVQPVNAPVRVEVRRYEDFDNVAAPVSIHYVNVPVVDQQGVYSSKLSDILGPLAVVESPLKERTSRIYRVGPLAEPVTLGHGSDITDPGSRTLVNNPFIDTHNVERTEWNGTEMFTGVKIYYEQRSMQTLQQHGSQMRDLPERNPASQQGPLPRAKQSTTTGSSTSGKKRSHQQRSPSTSDRSDADLSDSQPVDPEEELYPFLRRILGLNPQNLPGQWQVKTAREALNRHLAVAAGVEVAEGLGWKIPTTDVATRTVPADEEGGEPDYEDIPIPETIRGIPITKQHLQHVFGFSGDTTWWNLGKRWSKKELKGAKIVYAWSQNPDETVVNQDTGKEEARYPHLNKLLFKQLKSVVALDQAGKYTRHGPLEESDESEEVDHWSRDWDRRPQGSRSGG